VSAQSKSRRFSVCAIYSHPLLWEEIQQLLAQDGVQLRGVRLQSLQGELRRISLPRAKVYVLEGSGPHQFTSTLLGEILEKHPKARVVVLAEKLSDANTFPFLRQGAKGLLTYRDLREQLSRALRAVADGGYWVPRSLLSRFVEGVLNSASGHGRTLAAGHLSQRERQVLDCLLENLANKEIAAKLFISERTVKFHVSNLLAKFGVRRRADLILLCYQQRSLS
jgi:DNA-binding NarL/FixJ family response regulator